MGINGHNWVKVVKNGLGSESMNTKMLFCLSPDFSKVTFQIEKNIFEISIRFSSLLQHIISQSPNFAMIYMLPSSSRIVVAWNGLIFFCKWKMVYGARNNLFSRNLVVAI